MTPSTGGHPTLETAFSGDAAGDGKGGVRRIRGGDGGDGSAGRRSCDLSAVKNAIARQKVHRSRVHCRAPSWPWLLKLLLAVRRSSGWWLKCSGRGSRRFRTRHGTAVPVVEEYEEAVDGVGTVDIGLGTSDGVARGSSLRFAWFVAKVTYGGVEDKFWDRKSVESGDGRSEYDSFA